MSGLVDEATFHAVMACIEPTVDPDGPQGLEIKRRLEGCAGTLVALYRSKGFTEDKTKNFGVYAAAGDHFLKGLAEIQQYVTYHFDLLERLTGERREALLLIDPEFVNQAEKIIYLMRFTENFSENSNKREYKNQDGPNSKPWLHETVLSLWQIWDDQGQTIRKKKEFIDFCFAFLDPAGLHITRNAIEESYDRHVKHQIETLREIRRLSSSRQLEI